MHCFFKITPGYLVLVLSSLALLSTGCGVDFSSGTTIVAQNNAGPDNPALGNANLANAFANGGAADPVAGFNGVNPVAAAAANANGDVIGAVLNANGNVVLQKAAGGARSVSQIQAALSQLDGNPEFTNRLSYVSSMTLDTSKTTLFLMDTVAQPVPNAGRDQSGLIFVVNTLTDSVSSISLSGDIDLPMGICYGADGMLYFTAMVSGQGRVYKISTSGGTATRVGSALTFVEPTAIATDGTFFFVYDVVGPGNAGKVFRFDSTGADKVEMASVTAVPASQPLAVANQENYKILFFVDGNTVKAINLASGSNLASTVVPSGRVSDISSIFYANNQSTLLVSSEASKQVIKGSSI